MGGAKHQEVKYGFAINHKYVVSEQLPDFLDICQTMPFQIQITQQLRDCT